MQRLYIIFRILSPNTVFSQKVKCYFSRFGNQPFSTLFRCSKSSPIDHNEEAPHTANRVEINTFSTISEPITAATPIKAKTHQQRTPK